MFWGRVFVWCMIVSLIIATIVLFMSFNMESYSSPVYAQWHPANYFQGVETTNNRERYFDWMPYNHLYANINLGSWDRPKPLQEKTAESALKLSTPS